MRIHYPTAILEPTEHLQALERRLRGTRPAGRVRMLLLLNTEGAKSLKTVAPLLGYSLVQVTRWWECYKTRGIDGLVEQHPHPGKCSQMTKEAWFDLESRMVAGRSERWKRLGSILNGSGTSATKAFMRFPGCSSSAKSNGKQDGGGIGRPTSSSKTPLKKLWKSPQRAKGNLRLCLG